MPNCCLSAPILGQEKAECTLKHEVSDQKDKNMVPKKMYKALPF